MRISYIDVGASGRLAAYVKQSRYVKEASWPSGIPWRGHGSDNRRANRRGEGTPRINKAISTRVYHSLSERSS